MKTQRLNTEIYIELNEGGEQRPFCSDEAEGSCKGLSAYIAGHCGTQEGGENLEEEYEEAEREW